MDIDSEIMLKSSTSDVSLKYTIPNVLKNEFKCCNQNFSYSHLTKSIRNKANIENIVFIKAGNGKTLFTINKSDGITKTFEFVFN